PCTPARREAGIAADRELRASAGSVRVDAAAVRIGRVTCAREAHAAAVRARQMRTERIDLQERGVLLADQVARSNVDAIEALPTAGSAGLTGRLAEAGLVAYARLVFGVNTCARH